MGFLDRLRAKKKDATTSDRADDFSAFSESEHMFFGIAEPYAMIRAELAAGLQDQVPGSEVISIRTRGKPKFLTLGRKSDEQKMIVAFFGFAVQADLSVRAGDARHELKSTLSFMFGKVDEALAQRTMRTFFDLNEDADSAFGDDEFKTRFLAFRSEHPES